MKDSADTTRSNYVIPLGGFKLLSVLALAVGLFFVGSWYETSLGVLLAFLVVQAASHLTPHGWMSWLRDYYYRNIRAQLLWVHINKDGVVEQKIYPYSRCQRPNLEKTQLRSDPAICIVLSGWRRSIFRRAWVEYDEKRRVAHWYIVPVWSYIGDVDEERRTWWDENAPRLKSIQLAERQGLTYVPLSLYDAIKAMRRLTKLGKGERDWMADYVVGFTPFSELIAGVLATPNTTPVAKTGTGDDVSAPPNDQK